jgi:hypothetical protein
MRDRFERDTRVSVRGTLSRRALLVAVGAAGACAMAGRSPSGAFGAVDGLHVASGPARARQADLSLLNRESFAAVVGDNFAISAQDGRRVTARLEEVRELQASSASVVSRASQPSLECFTLHFRGTDPALASATHQFAHPWLGEFPLFVVPAEVADGATCYVAVINRLPV